MLLGNNVLSSGVTGTCAGKAVLQETNGQPMSNVVMQSHNRLYTIKTIKYVCLLI
jgi:hypothetical protein